MDHSNFVDDEEELLFGTVEDQPMKPSVHAPITEQNSTQDEDIAEPEANHILVSIESDLSKLKLDEEPDSQQLSRLRGKRVDEVMFIESARETDQFLHPVQIFAISEYTLQDVTNLVKIFEYDRNTFEKIIESQKKEQENKKLNVARKTVKTTAENVGIMINTDSQHPGGLGP